MTKKSQYSIEELAKLIHADAHGNSSHLITGVADLEHAQSEDASFFHNTRYLKRAQLSKAGVIVVPPDFERDPNKNYLVHKNPDAALQILLELFFPKKERSGFSGIHPSAVIHPDAKIGTEVTIGPNAVIDAGVVIGNNSIISANVSIGRDTIIGSNCLIHPNVSIRENCSIGDRCIIQSGASIGSCGYGYTTDEKGIHTKLEHYGKVIIEDDVEIGANCSIDRGRFKSTQIGQGTKVDNLVQIAHGVTIGRHALIVSQCGISGSTKIGNHTVIGGQVGLVGHIEIGDFVQIGAQSGVSKPLKKPGGYQGTPAQEISKHQRQQVLLRNIEKYVERIKMLEQKLEKLGSSIDS